ncbi:hypothetical protein EDD18DRAFT_1470586 [Armillaria luteobubalina]|uniref:Uncharacterized protein n=1 Tax=Armillaria luteobubalina TaxID=153913 RepID=A0AA39NZE8_9AGAR|nr:hypothetical protein EDD18DRAFT_1470586 [Armillaria luteobubalina]
MDIEMLCEANLRRRTATLTWGSIWSLDRYSTLDPHKACRPPRSQQVSPGTFRDFKNSQRLLSFVSVTFAAASTAAGTRDDTQDTIFSAIELVIRSQAVWFTCTLPVTAITRTNRYLQAVQSIGDASAHLRKPELLRDGAARSQDFEGVPVGHWQALGSAFESARLRNGRGSRFWFQGTLQVIRGDPMDDYDDATCSTLAVSLRRRRHSQGNNNPPTSNHWRHCYTTATPSTAVSTAAGSYRDTARIIFMVLVCIVPSPPRSFLSRRPISFTKTTMDSSGLPRTSRCDSDTFGMGHGRVVDRRQVSSTINTDDFDAHQR